MNIISYPSKARGQSWLCGFRWNNIYLAKIRKEEFWSPQLAVYLKAHIYPTYSRKYCTVICVE